MFLSRPRTGVRAKKQTQRTLCAGIFALLIALLALSALSCLEPVGFEEDNIPPSERPLEEPPAEDPPPPGPDPILSVPIPGIQPVTGATGERFSSVPEKYTGDIRWEPALANGKFEPFKDYTATIELAMKQGHSLPPEEAVVTVEGALSAAYDAATGTITAQFPRTHYPVNNEAGLTAAIAALTPLPQDTGANNKNIIEFTDAFYGDVNTAGTPLYINIGADNTIPYTIRGLGNEDPAPALQVGILLANDNITLEDVRIEITDSTKGVPRKWTSTSNYRAAILIGRFIASAPPFEFGSGSHNVTVKNCDISFGGPSATGMIGGILLTGNEQNVSIADNTVSVEAAAGSAAQALLVLRYDPSVSITGNGFKSQNIAATHGNPASAIFMQVRPDMAPSVTPLISGNRINGNPTYDFYINILSDGTGNRTGVLALTANKFATPQSTWMTAASTDTGSFYKKLLTTLLDQSRTGAGYGYLSMYFGSNDCVFECYVQEDSRVRAIDFWGYTITGGAYTTTNVRARLLLNTNGSVSSNTGPFHWWANGGIDSNITSP